MINDFFPQIAQISEKNQTNKLDKREILTTEY